MKVLFEILEGKGVSGKT